MLKVIFIHSFIDSFIDSFIHLFIDVSVTTCELVTASIPRAAGLVRFSCDKQPHLTEACKVTLNGQEYTSANLHTDASSLAFTADMTALTLGEEYTLTFTDCAVAAQATITIANGRKFSLTHSLFHSFIRNSRSFGRVHRTFSPRLRW